MTFDDIFDSDSINKMAEEIAKGIDKKIIHEWTNGFILINFKPCTMCKNRFYNELIKGPTICLENKELNYKKRKCSKFRYNDEIIKRRKL